MSAAPAPAPDDALAGVIERSHGLTRAQELRLMDAIYARGDRLLGWFLAAHGLAALGLACYYDTWLTTAVVGGAALAMFFVARALAPRSFVTRCVAGVALQTFVALHIYQLHGLMEMHFFFFTAFTVLVVYQDWLSMWPGTLLIIGQHILFALLHNSGTNLYFFEDPYVGFRKLSFHFGIALVHVGLCGYWAVLMRRQTLRDAWQRLLLGARNAQLSQDIEDRRAVERELEGARRAAESANHAKGAFLANMSHEIRTPMNGVIGMTELVLGTPLASEQRENLGVVLASSRALLQILNDILDFSKIEAGKLSLQPAPLRLRALLSECLRLFRPRAEEKGLALERVVAADVPDNLVGDAARLRQVILNLVGNALKFTDRGRVALEVELVRATDAGATECTLEFRVRDTGIGIAPAEQALLFQPFSQVGEPGQRRASGTGLGLAICRQLIELMHGTLALESTPGRGSTFVFRARLGVCNDEALAPPAAPATPAAARTPLRVLVAEDNAVNQRIAAGLLARVGHTVVLAGSGRAALAALERESFDLVFMDVGMPELDGLETTREIRRREAGTGRHVPVVAMTARAMSGDRELCLRAGMDGYLTKPIEVEALERVLRELSARPLAANVNAVPAALPNQARDAAVEFEP